MARLPSTGSTSSRPVSGAYYFAPPLNLLMEMAMPIGEAEIAAPVSGG